PGGPPSHPPANAACFRAGVRKHLERQYVAQMLYEHGLALRTAPDVAMQEAANRTLEHGLRTIDKRHGYRKPRRNVMVEAHTLEGFKDDRWNRPFAAGDVVPAVVITAPKAGAARLRIGRLDRKSTRLNSSH